MNIRKLISRLSFAAGICVLSMFLVTIFTGISQEILEVNQNAQIYSQKLIEAEYPLRVIFSFDFIFICLFVTVFVLIIQYLKTEDGALNMIATVSMIMMIITGILDFWVVFNIGEF